MKKHVKKALITAGLVIAVAGILGSVGALECDRIDVGQALLQVGICGAVGAGLMIWGCRM